MASEIEPQLRQAIGVWPYAELYRQLESNGIAFGPVRRMHEVLADPQLVARQMAVKIDGPHGIQTFVRQPLRFDGISAAIGRQAPGLGEHGTELFGARSHS